MSRAEASNVALADAAAGGPAVSSNAAVDVVGSDDAGYPGSKGSAGVYHKIIGLMPPHRVYVELFLGHGAVMRHKRPARFNIGVDADPRVIGWWQRHLRERRWPRLSSLMALHDDALQLPQILASLPSVGAAAHGDAGTLVYADPPYLAEVRTRLFYDHEFESPAQHEALLHLLRGLQGGCMAMISGYRSALYTRMLVDEAGWNFISYPAMTRGGLREEFLWFNFAPPTVLHDSRYAGRNYRERDRISQKRKRWRRRLEAMPPLERQVLVEAMDDLRSSNCADVTRVGSDVTDRTAGSDVGGSRINLGGGA